MPMRSLCSKGSTSGFCTGYINLKYPCKSRNLHTCGFCHVTQNPLFEKINTAFSTVLAIFVTYVSPVKIRTPNSNFSLYLRLLHKSRKHTTCFMMQTCSILAAFVQKPQVERKRRYLRALK